MNSIELGLSGSDALRYFKGTPARINRDIDRLLARLRNEGIRKAKNEAPKAETTLSNSILGRRVSQSHHTIIANQHYARYVEEGTGPGGSVPQQSLEDWVRVKGITPTDIYTSEEQMMYLIARSIRRKGTPAQPYMKPAYAHILEQTPAAARRVAADAINPTNRS